MDSVTIKDSNAAIQEDASPAKGYLRSSWRARRKSRRYPELHGSHAGPYDEQQASKDDHRSSTAPSTFIAGVEQEFREILDHNVRKKSEQDPSKKKEWHDWGERAFKNLQDNYTRRQHPKPELSQSSPKGEGLITYLARNPTSTLGNKHDVLYLSRELNLENSTNIRTSLDEAQTQWDSEHGSRLANSNQPSAIRWIHLQGNNEQRVRSAMSNTMATSQTARENPHLKQTDWDSMADCVFKNRFWRNQRSETQHNPEFSRTMKPFASYIECRPGSRDARSSKAKINCLVAFMPYLHWENSIAATFMRHVVRDVQRNGSNANVESLSDRFQYQDEVLLRTFLSGDSSVLHHRRTLDQFAYPTMEDTAERDRDQVVERHALDYHFDETTDFGLGPPILMVDQCWVWAIGSDTVLTAFPRTWNFQDGCDDPIDLYRTILQNIRLERKHYRYLSSSCHFARFVIRMSSSNLLLPSKQVREQHKFLQHFDDAIGLLRERTNEKDRQLSQSLTKQDDGSKSTNVLDVREEHQMTLDAKDMMEELQMMEVVVAHQDETMRQFEQSQVRFIKRSKDLRDSPSVRMETGSILDRPATKARHENVGRLYLKAENLCADIYKLLNTKQQNAAIMEAHFTREMNKQSGEQGEIFLLFTVVTIIFLPLSTLASIFGINSDTFGSGSMGLGKIFAYILPISAICVVSILTIGLSGRVRNSLLKLFCTPNGDEGSHSISANDLTSPTRQHSASTVPSQARTQSSSMTTLVSSSNEPSSVGYRKREMNFPSPIKKVANQTSFSEQATSVSTPRSYRRPNLHERRPSCKTERISEPHNSDDLEDVAMYSFSSGNESSANDSDSTEDEQARSDTSLRSTGFLRRRAGKHGKSPVQD